MNTAEYMMVASTPLPSQATSPCVFSCSRDNTNTSANVFSSPARRGEENSDSEFFMLGPNARAKIKNLNFFDLGLFSATESSESEFLGKASRTTQVIQNLNYLRETNQGIGFTRTAARFRLPIFGPNNDEGAQDVTS
jgi:hypothetical protein